ncbi:MAG: L,D-transpeptidase [Deltaproteobacteria bacterium]|nr:L,D-transpeptidase [Deltaproteobacteria bacterium]
MKSRVVAVVPMLLMLVGWATLAGCRRAHTDDAATKDGVPVEAGVEGEIEPATAPTAEKAKIAARAMEAFVYEQPSASSKKLGYLRAGAIVETRGGVATKNGCPGGWVPIQPAGFVCMGREATANLDDAIVKASFRRPDLSAGLPYGYAIVRNQGAPFYARLPSKDEAKQHEPDWEYHFRTLEGAEAEESKEGGYPQLSSMPKGKFPLEPAPGVLAPWATDNKDDPLPALLSAGNYVPNLSGLVWSQRPAYEGGTSCDPKAKGCIPLDAARPRKRLGVSFIATYDVGERRWLQTTDLLLMPADRVRLVRGTSFHGYELGDGAGKLKLPIVIVKKEGVSRFTFDGKRMTAKDDVAWRAALEAGKKQRIVAGTKYHELADGNYVREEDVVRLDPIKKMPKWGKDGERWIEVNITKQTLLAVDGETPVYATLVSTGAGGLASPKDNPYVTPRGIFRIHTKHVAATMDSNQPEAEFELRDVPYIQYFKDGYALHAAYWHDQFGQPRSHGCINLAPLDARWMFHFTKPELPTGWHGVMKALTGTIVWVHA